MRTKRNVLSKACPKCRGDLYRQMYLGSEEEYTCLQCGMSIDKQQAERLVAQQAAA